MFPTKFQVICSFGSGEETKNRFSRWLPRRTSWISNRNGIGIFFQDGGYGGHLGFLTGTNLTIFNLQVTMMLPMRSRVIWPREE